MITHNIGFYEDLTKIIFELSSNIIKYAPYFVCCIKHYGVELYNVYIHDMMALGLPGLVAVKFGILVFIWGKVLESQGMGNNLQLMTKLPQGLCLRKNDTMGCLHLPKGHVHLYK